MSIEFIPISLCRMDKPREQWANNVEFLIASTGMSIGLGNIWRFPYVAYENGGGESLPLESV